MFGFSCAEWTIPNVLIRIVVSMILGCVIGLDRGLKKRGAGTKTNTIVCLGATLVMLTAQYMEVYFPGKSDLSRMASQVISGVGFLGVGTIIVSGHQVRGQLRQVYGHVHALVLQWGSGFWMVELSLRCVY